MRWPIYPVPLPLWTALREPIWLSLLCGRDDELLRIVLVDEITVQLFQPLCMCTARRRYLFL